MNDFQKMMREERYKVLAALPAEVCEQPYIDLETFIDKLEEKIENQRAQLVEAQRSYNGQSKYTTELSIQLHSIRKTIKGIVNGIHGTRCCLCLCAVAGEKFGYPVCAYHLEHGEDDPSCTTCNHPSE